MDAQEGMTPVEQMLAGKAEELTDLVLRYQGMGVGGPQSAIVEVLGGIWSAADLAGWDRGFDHGSAKARSMAQRLCDTLTTIETNDSVQRGGYGRASRDAVDLISHRVLGRRWPRG